ncbi:DUF4232 domain-containing protein [Streptomyces sp. NPDC006012]|uniref:DUF4232 domain-containing protein n=1 Tax=Streptomyces sp. NPDC006012 TaxID=3364739 RepID=UPI003685B7BB
MRVIPLSVTLLAAALTLTACNDGGGSTNSKGDSGCKIGGVSVQIGSASVAPGAGDTGEVPVSITNQSAPCTLDDFPGVELVTGGSKVAVPVNEGAKAQKLKLAKGDFAAFTITYVRGAAGDGTSLAAKTVEISLPGAKDTESFPWSYGPVAGKGGSDKVPNASVSAFQQSGD